MPNLNKFQLASIAAASMLVAYIGVAALAQTDKTPQELDIPSILTADAAAVDYFLKIDGIPGESKDSRHAGEIDVLSFSWGVAQTGTSSAGGGGGAGKAVFQDISFTTAMNKASPKLFQACASGEHIKEAVLTAVKTDKKDKQEYMIIKMTDVLVSSYQTGGSSGQVPVDQFSLNYAKIEIEYRPINPDGSLGEPIKAGWDLKANEGV
jgi:type VI secretion system secreted protein Hcp